MKVKKDEICIYYIFSMNFKFDENEKNMTWHIWSTFHYNKVYFFIRFILCNIKNSYKNTTKQDFSSDTSALFV